MSEFDPSALPTAPSAGGSGVDWSKLSGALGDLSKSMQQSQGQGVQNIAAGNPQGASGAGASSQVVAGSPGTMNNFTQMLLDHIAKLQAASNPLAGARPIGAGRSGIGGLLGL